MSSTQDSSPHRPHQSRPRSNHRRDSFTSSQARRLVEDLSRIVLHDDRHFNQALDSQAAEQEHRHRIALDRALAEHEAVRRAAELTREKIELELQQDRIKQELQQKQDVEEKKRQLAEEEAVAQRSQLELVRKSEDALKEVAALRAKNLAAEQRVEDEKKTQEETRQRDLAEKAAAAQRKAQADAAAAQEAKQRAAQAATPAPAAAANSQIASSAGQSSAVPPSQPPPQSNGSSAIQTAAATAGITTTPEQREVEHRKYLDLHKRLKGMRDDVKKQCSQHPQLKNSLGDWRRAIIKCVGQQNKVDKAANRSSVSIARLPMTRCSDC
nr:nucleoporin gle1 [Quercus suber]